MMLRIRDRRCGRVCPRGGRDERPGRVRSGTEEDECDIDALCPFRPWVERETSSILYGLSKIAIRLTLRLTVIIASDRAALRAADLACYRTFTHRRACISALSRPDYFPRRRSGRTSPPRSRGMSALRH